MTKPNDGKGNNRSGVSLPGQPTEEAIAEVGSAAGNSLIRGLARLGCAWTGKWTASQEARAEAVRIAIETSTEIEKQKTLAAARRVYEVDEMEHQAALQRRAARLRSELAREQLNLEAIELRAFELIENDPLRENPREMDDDWLCRFMDLAQKVSSKDIQELWARLLASAAIDGKTRVSPAALQLLALMDKKVAEHFVKFASIESFLAGVPYSSDDVEPFGIDIFLLSEAGLVTRIRKETRFEIFGARVGVDIDGSSVLIGEETPCWGMTYRGVELYRAVVKGRELPLSSDLLSKYAQNIIANTVRWGSAAIVPIANGSLQNPIVIVMRDSAQSTGQPWDSSLVHQLNVDLAALLGWAGENYSLRVRC